MSSSGGGALPPPPPPPPPLPPPNQQQLPTSSSATKQQDVDMMSGLSPQPSTSVHQQQSPNNAVTTASTPSSTSSTTAGSSSSTTAGPATASTTTITTRNKRQELSFAERIQVILARKSGKSMRQLALQFGCGKTQILNILGQRESYLKEWDEKQAESNPHISSRKRRSRRTGNEETNRLVWDWYNVQKDLGIRVTGPMLQREARSIARTLGITNFAASNGWLDSFRRLHNIGPQSRGAQQDRRNASTTTTPSGAIIQIETTTPEPTSTMASYPPDFGYPNNPTSSGDALSPSTTSSTTHSQTLPPPPPLEVFGYPHHGYYPDEEHEEDDDEDGRRHRSSEDVDFESSEQADPLMHHNSNTEFKHFGIMAAGFSSGLNPSENESCLRTHPSYDPSTVPSVVMDSEHRYSDHYDRIHHSSSSSNSLAFSPTEVYRPPTGNNGSRTNDPYAMDCRPAPPFQPVVSSAYSTQQPSSQSEAISRIVIQDARTIVDVEARPTTLQQQQQQRRSVLVSTRSAAAAAAAAATAALENQDLIAPDHEKRRLFVASSSGSSSSPGLEPLPGFFGALISMVRSSGLSSLEYSDDRGDVWLEIRPPASAAFRVPFYGYRTHLIRLIIDRHLSYWLEVLGHCIRSGTFRSLTSGGIDPSLVKPLLDLISGGATVCHGRGSVLKRVHQFSPRAALEQGLAGRNYFTLPDYRYRSYDCLRLVDTRSGVTQCSSCSKPTEPSHPPPLEGIHTPSSLRLQRQQPHDIQSRQQQQHQLHQTDQQYQQQQQQYQQQQQHGQQLEPQQHVIQHPTISPSEPLNLSLHHPIAGLARPSLESKTNEFVPVSSTITSTAIFSADQHIVVDPIPTVIAQPQQQQQQPQQHHHHHHHHYRCGSSSSGLDQNADDYRLANKTSFLSLTSDTRSSSSGNSHNCFKEWNHSGEDCSRSPTSTIVQTKQSIMTSSPRRNRNSDEGPCHDPEFHSGWIKQETFEAKHSNGS